MAQMTTLIENIPSTPDLAALSAMDNPIVVVTKVAAGKGGNNQMIVNGQTGLTTQDILALHDTLPLGKIPNSGAGVYRFEVMDQGSGAKVIWQLRLGGAPVENPSPENTRPVFQAPAPMPVLQQQPTKPVPLAPEVQHLGNGWFYNPALDLLTAPDGSLHNWRKGMQLPTLSFGNPTPQAPATPLASLPAFTASPEADALRQQLAAMQSQLTEAREREREQRRQDEIREMQENFKRATEESNKRFEALVAQVSAPKDDGGSKVVELERRMAEKERIDSLRAETKAQMDSMLEIIRASSNNKGIDPMVTMLTTIMSQNQTSAAEQLRMYREAAAEERRTFTAMLDRQSLAAEKTAANNPFEKLAGGFDVLMDRMGRIMEMERNFNGSGSQGVDWMGVIKEVGSKAGSALQAFQMAKAREAQATQAQAQATTAQAQAAVVHDKAMVEVARQRRLAAPSAPAPVPTPPMTPPVELMEGPAVTGPAIVAPAKRGVNPSAATAKTKKRSAPEELKLADLTLKDLRLTFKDEADQQFFGSSLEYVQQLRDAIESTPGENTADDIAGFILQARELIAEEAAKGNIPHAAELLVHGQIAYLVERMLPAANEGLRSEITKAIKKQLQAEEDAARVAAASSEPVAS
jgi:hypothetical protein